MQLMDILIIVFIVIGLIVGAFILFNRWASKKVTSQQNLVEKTKQPATIYVIDKKHDKAANVNLPKAVSAKLPRVYKFMKMYFVKVKVGPQIITLMCDKHVFSGLHPKKTYHVELSGIYIAHVRGLKTQAQLKQIAKDKKKKEKADKKTKK